MRWWKIVSNNHCNNFLLDFKKRNRKPNTIPIHRFPIIDEIINYIRGTILKIQVLLNDENVIIFSNDNTTSSQNNNSNFQVSGDVENTFSSSNDDSNKQRRNVYCNIERRLRSQEDRAHQLLGFYTKSERDNIDSHSETCFYSAGISKIKSAQVLSRTLRYKYEQTNESKEDLRNNNKTKCYFGTDTQKKK